MSYGAMRPGFNTLVGRELFRICEDWIGGVSLGVCLGELLMVFVILLFEITKKTQLFFKIDIFVCHLYWNPKCLDLGPTRVGNP